MVTYLYGKVTKSKFYTPLRTYTHSTTFPNKLSVNKMLPCIFTTKIEVFYLSPIFNSYIIQTEENVTKLYAVDGKTTIIKSKTLKTNVIYTFRVVVENSNIRICELFDFKSMVWVGKEVTGKIEIKKNKVMINTTLGNHHCVLSNNVHDKRIKAILWKVEDDKMSFVEVGNPVKDVITMNIDKITETLVFVANDNVRGLIHKKDLVSDITDKTQINCFVKEEMLGFYLFGEAEVLRVNDVVNALVYNKGKTIYKLKCQGYNGFVKTININPLCINDKMLRGTITNIENGTFEFSQNEGISIPFDIKQDEEVANDTQQDESKEVGTYTNDTDRIDLSVIFDKIKKLTERKQYDEVKSLYHNNIQKYDSQDKETLTVVYFNFLEYTKQDVLKELRKISKNCTERLYEKIGINSEIVDVIQYCYNKNTSKPLFEKCISSLYNSEARITEIEKIILDNDKYMDVSIEKIYEYENEPRIMAEKVVGTSRAGWLKYIEKESDEDYKRFLYRRVIGLQWKISEMKEWYRLWMRYEKSINGNIDEVRSRAKQFVETVKCQK